MNASQRYLNPTDRLSEIQHRIRTRLDQKQATNDGAKGSAVDVDLRELNETVAALSSSGANVGEMPPVPPTLRGRVGTLLVRMVARALFWYTPQIRAFHQLVAETVKRLGNAFRIVSSEIEAGREALETAELRWERGITDLRTSSKQEVESLQNTLGNAERRIKALEQQPDKTLQQRLNELDRSFIRLQETVTLQERRMSVLLAARTREERSHFARTADAESPPALDELYLSFENQFRGTKEDIKGRLRVYLSNLEQAGRTTVNPVLDLGCGRGEWLDLLAENGFVARGVDSNYAMVKECRARGFEVTEADALEYMQSLSDQSVGAVTGFHIVEHLPFETLIHILDEAVRILKPGGIAIFETPNPANLIVGANTFYYDPTHRNPIPAPTLEFLGGSRGLCHTQTLALHPHPDSEHFADTADTVRKLNEYLHGPQDYAFIGMKPR